MARATTSFLVAGIAFEGAIKEFGCLNVPPDRPVLSRVGNIPVH